jgi:hypothetical protein
VTRSERRVLTAAGAMIVAQLAFRAWATYGSWYHYDDFSFMARMADAGPTLRAAFEPYIGHLTPGGMYLSWLADAVAPYDFRVTATMLLVLQAGASVALLWMLVRVFGVRPGILPPFALYLFCVITTPAAIWWAAGVAQLPWHIALFAGLGTHATYLRTHRLRYALMTVAWSAFGLLFFERTILLFGAVAFLSLAYFATGTLGVRAVSVLRTYWRGVLVYAAALGAYLVAYVVTALDLGSDAPTSGNLGRIAWDLVGNGYVTALAGGPLRWHRLDQAAVPDPGSAVLWASVAAVGLLVWEIRRARTRSLRAWLLPLAFLVADVVLVAAGRTTYLGTIVSLDYRSQAELGAVTALALALAVLPVRGAVEPVEVRRSSELLDHPRRVTLVVVVPVALALVSSTLYVRHWQTHDPGQAYFDNLIGTLTASRQPVVLDDTTVPEVVMGADSYPDNRLSRLLTAYEEHTSFPDAAIDSVSTVTDEGTVVAAVIRPLEQAPPGPDQDCGYRVAGGSRTIELVPTGIEPGPDVRGNARSWVRIGYLSTGTSPVTVEVGDETISATIVGGLHALFVRTDLVADPATHEPVGSVTLSGLQGDAQICTDDVTAGPLLPLPTADGASTDGASTDGAAS